jgi:phage baseplate assembly protein W
MQRRYFSQPIRLIGDFGAIALSTDPDRHLRDKLLAILFTSPGERVNHPEFGVGLRRTLFEGIDDLMLAALRFQIIQGLRRDIGPEIAVDDLRIESDPEAGEVAIFIDYRRVADDVPQGLEVRL